MSFIGIRVQPDTVWYAVIEDEEAKVYGLEVPRVLDLPLLLQYVRTNMLDIFEEVGAEAVGVRLTEGFGQRNVTKGQLMRFHIEAVIQEAIASSRVSGLFRGRLKDISSCLGYSEARVKRMIAKEEPFPEMAAIWDNTNQFKREALLTAAATQLADTTIQ